MLLLKYNLNLDDIYEFNVKLSHKFKILSAKIPFITRKFAEILGTTLSYLIQIENNKVNLKCSTIDKFATKINSFDKELHLKVEELVIFNQKHITNFTRIDEKNKKY